MDDDIKNFFQDDRPENPNNLFALYRYSLDGVQAGIRAFEVISDYIFVLTDTAEFYKININQNKNYMKTPFSLPGVSAQDFKLSKFEKIWVDKYGNYAIIKFNEKYFFFKDKIYLLNHLNQKFIENNENKDKENETLNCVEFCFDRRNKNLNSTQEILVADINFNLYSYKIDITNQGIKESLIFLMKLPNGIDKSDKIFGLQFFANDKLEKNTIINYYIMIVTKNKIYQFLGVHSLIEVFKEYNHSQQKLKESVIILPTTGKNFTFSKLQFTYNENNFYPQSFGWLTESGFCYGNFNGNEVPDKLNNFIVLPYVKIKKDGNRDVDSIPKNFSHSKNHIFILYSDCISIISKITNNIIDSQYVIYDDFSNSVYDEKNFVWVINSTSNIYQIFVNAGNKYLWQDYLEIGDFLNAIDICKKEKPELVSKIEKLYAEENFNKNNYTIAATYYPISDEKFEDVCLKFLQKNELEGLSNYLNSILDFRLKERNNNEEEVKLEKDNDELDKIKNKENIQKCLICTWLIEIYLNQVKNNPNNQINNFRQLIRGREQYLDKETIYQLLQNYGRTEEFIEFAELKEDYETVILHYINEKDIKKALEKIKNYCLYSDDDITKKKLGEIFEKFAFLFMKNYPKDTIDLLNKVFKKIIPPEKIVSAIMNTSSNKEGNENFSEILNYLRDLIKGNSDNKNIHNLYLFYLSKCNTLEEKNELINYLKYPFGKDPILYSNNQSKRKINFELDYAKKIFKDNYPALALVIALMGKYSEGVKIALEKNCQDIAMFIATNVQDDAVKKNLWLDIFSSNKNEDFKNALEVMDQSKILKIEDVLPRIMDNIKIEEFKDQISKCINLYEDNIKKLRDDINQYNQTAENIKNDIYKVKKKSIEIQYRQCKCDICQSNIKDNNIFLFPCGHMFDSKCIINSLENFKKYISNEKNNKKKNIFESIDSKLNKINEYDKEIKEIENKRKNTNIENQKGSILGSLINVIGKQNKIEVQELTKEQEKKLRDYTELLNDILSEECVLCGDYMVESTQSLFAKDNKISWKI